MTEQKRSFKISTSSGVKDYFEYTGQTVLPPLIRPVTSAREVQRQFVENKYPFGEAKDYPPYVLAFSINQNGFFLLDTRVMKTMNQVCNDPEELCEIIGDVFWPPLSEEEEKKGLTCRSLIPKNSKGKLGDIQKTIEDKLRDEYLSLKDMTIGAGGVVPPEIYERLEALEKHFSSRSG